MKNILWNFILEHTLKHMDTWSYSLLNWEIQGKWKYFPCPEGFVQKTCSRDLGTDFSKEFRQRLEVKSIPLKIGLLGSDAKTL